MDKLKFSQLVPTKTLIIFGIKVMLSIKKFKYIFLIFTLFAFLQLLPSLAISGLSFESFKGFLFIFIFILIIVLIIFLNIKIRKLNSNRYEIDEWGIQFENNHTKSTTSWNSIKGFTEHSDHIELIQTINGLTIPGHLILKTSIDLKSFIELLDSKNIKRLN